MEIQIAQLKDEGFLSSMELGKTIATYNEKLKPKTDLRDFEDVRFIRTIPIYKVEVMTWRNFF